MDYVQYCEESCLDFNTKHTGSHVQGSISNLVRVELQKEEIEEGAGRQEIGVFLNPILWARPVSECVLMTAGINSHSVVLFFFFS